MSIEMWMPRLKAAAEPMKIIQQKAAAAISTVQVAGDAVT